MVTVIPVERVTVAFRGVPSIGRTGLRLLWVAARLPTVHPPHSWNLAYRGIPGGLPDVE